jgi:hypothetical protein
MLDAVVEHGAQSCPELSRRTGQVFVGEIEQGKQTVEVVFDQRVEGEAEFLGQRLSIRRVERVERLVQRSEGRDRLPLFGGVVGGEPGIAQKFDQRQLANRLPRESLGEVFGRLHRRRPDEKRLP